MKISSVLVLAGLLAGCGLENPTKTDSATPGQGVGNEEELDGKTTLYVDDSSNLPGCNPKREGTLAYLLKIKEFRACNEGNWQAVSIQGPEGKVGVTGSKGDAGDKGGSGEKGVTGDTGPAGIQGVNGTSCALSQLQGGAKITCGGSEYVLANPGTTVVVSQGTISGQSSTTVLPTGQLYFVDANNVTLGNIATNGANYLSVKDSADREYIFTIISGQFVLNQQLLFLTNDCTGQGFTSANNAVLFDGSNYWVPDLNANGSTASTLFSSRKNSSGSCSTDDVASSNIMPIIQFNPPSAIVNAVAPLQLRQAP